MHDPHVSLIDGISHLTAIDTVCNQTVLQLFLLLKRGELQLSDTKMSRLSCFLLAAMASIICCELIAAQTPINDFACCPIGRTDCPEALIACPLEPIPRPPFTSAPTPPPFDQLKEVWTLFLDKWKDRFDRLLLDIFYAVLSRV